MSRRRSQTESSGARSRANLRPLRMLLPYLKRVRWRVAGATVALVVAAGATLAMPLAVRQMIDHGFGGDGAAVVNTVFAGLIGLVAILALASAARYYFVTVIGERVVADLRVDVFEHLGGLGVDFFDRSQSGELVSRLTADTTQLKAAAGSNISVALRNVLLFLGAIAMMVATSPRLSSMVLLAIPAVVLPLVAFGRMVRGRSRTAQDTLAGASALAAETIGANRTIKAFGLEGLITGRYAAAVEAAFEAARRSIAARALLTGCVIFLVFASMVGVLWSGAQDVLSDRMSPGELGQFLFYAVFAAGALGELSTVWGELAQASGAAERLAELLVERPSIVAPADPLPMPKPARGAIGFERVNFAYAARPDAQALRDISFTVQPGERIAIVGPSGAGKSTLFSLLLRFYDPTSGTIRFDGADLRAVGPAELRRRIAVVPQEVVIFSASAAENIRLGRPDADMAAIRRAAEAAHATDFIEALPKGFDTELGERGVMLSGGERQRIAVARAILKDAPLLLLDEATSALDAESEAAVQAALERLMEGRTSLVIAHRLATVLRADRILVIEDGRIVEQGRHANLIAAGGLYARLARLQFQDAAE